MASKRKVVKVKAKKLTKAEMRVAVCKDVLARIRAKKIGVKHGRYLQLKGGQMLAELMGDNKSCDLQELVPVMKCNVCAKGALFLSAVDKYDDCELRRENSAIYGDSITVNNIHSYNNSIEYDAMQPTLNKLFSEAQLTMIEEAFEAKRPNYVYVNYLDGAVPPPNVKAAYEWGLKQPRGEARMVAIMKNVIKNGGEFKPVVK